MVNLFKWHKRMMDLAEFISSWSKDPSTKVGAVIVDENNRIVSTGYNGFPKCVKDLKSRYDNKDLKYKIILHAEENAILYAKRDLSNCKLYVSALPPCAHCASIIINSGIKTVIYKKQEIPEKWKESFKISKMMFKEAQVKLIAL